MKTIEEKAKAYDEALKRAKYALTTDMDKSGHWAVNYIFPQFKESEDERIRGAIIDHLKDNNLTEWADWLEKQSKDNMIEALQLEYEKGKADALQEQRKEWNEEDEKIRKALIKYLTTKDDNDYYVICGVSTKKIIAWLEKQGEKTVIGNGSNSASVSDGDNSVTSKEVVSYPTFTLIKPKFKVGDFIVNDYCMGRVVELTNDAYLLDTEQGIPFSCEHNVHLWTIQDAKEGDIIYIKRYKDNSEWLLIFKEIKSQNTFIDVYDYYAYSITSNNTYHEGFCGLWGLLLDDEIVCPATKEQCNLLFAKMKEEGFKWDAEKKDLKKISQEYSLTPDECIKSAWSEEDERIYHSLLADIRASQDGSTNTLEAYYNEQIDWLKSIKEKLKGE